MPHSQAGSVYLLVVSPWSIPPLQSNSLPGHQMALGPFNPLPSQSDFFDFSGNLLHHPSNTFFAHGERNGGEVFNLRVLGTQISMPKASLLLLPEFRLESLHKKEP